MKIFAAAIFAAAFSPLFAHAEGEGFPIEPLRFDATGGECDTEGPYASFEIDRNVIDIRSAEGDVESGDFVVVTATFHKVPKVFTYEVINRRTREESKFVLETQEGKITQRKDYLDRVNMVRVDSRAETVMKPCT